jgi:hypothetical protein
MKKVISVLVIMAVFSTTLFAAPLSLTGSTDQQARETYQSEFAFKAEVLEDDLFAEVQAVALSPEEAQAVEGEGFLSGLAGFVTGFMSGVIQYGYGSSVTIARGQNPGTPADQVSGMLTSALISGLAGGIAGFFVPIP